MGMLDRVRQAAAGAARTLVRLPVITDVVLETPRRERLAAEQGLVPRRCGLCRAFSRQRFVELQKLNPPFAEAQKYLEPAQMGSTREASYMPPGSVAARELRPELAERWEDYGACLKHNLVIWGFSEAPSMPEPTSAPCEAWR